MRGLRTSIEFYKGEKYCDLAYGTVYYVPGTASQELNAYVRAHAEEIAARLNEDERNWVTCRIVCPDRDNTLFVPQRHAALYSAMLPARYMPANAYSVLKASLDSSEPASAEEVFAAYFRTLQDMFDDILDDDDVDEDIDEGICYAEADRTLDFEPDFPDKCAKRSMPACGAMSINETVAYFNRPSRLEITSGTYKVLLPDYHREIHFTAQVKALYVLFLNHPEGIRMAEIGDYKEEYKTLYLYFTNRDNMERLRDSVEKLLDVLSPSALNVKKSQCSTALRHAIPEDELRQYYEIEVHRGEPHKINLDRSLVSMPEFLQKYSL